MLPHQLLSLAQELLSLKYPCREELELLSSGDFSRGPCGIRRKVDHLIDYYAILFFASKKKELFKDKKGSLLTTCQGTGELMLEKEKISLLPDFKIGFIL